MITNDFGDLVPAPAARGISQRLDDGDARMGRIEEDLATMRASLAENTAATKANAEAAQEAGKSTADLVEFFQAMKGLFRVLDWAGRLAKPVASIVGLGAALYAAWKANK